MYKYPLGLAYYQRLGPNGKALLGQDNSPLPDYSKPFVAPDNPKMTALDKVAACTTYPREAAYTGEDALTPDGRPTQGSIAMAGQVARYRFQGVAGSRVTIKTEGPAPTLTALLRSHNNPADRGGFAKIISAAESKGDAAPPLWNPILPVKDFDQGTYYLEVRHGSPKNGTGDFKISVAPG